MKKAIKAFARKSKFSATVFSTKRFVAKRMLGDKWLLFVSVLILVFYFARMFTLTHAMTHVDDIGPFAVDYLSFPTFFKFINNTTAYTQAPGYFAILFFAYKLGHDYDSILFWTRFPALTFWAVGLFCYFYVFYQSFGKRNRPLVFFLMTLSLISWRGWAESWQGYNYSTVSVVVPLFFHFFITTYQMNSDWLKSSYHWKKIALGFFLGTVLWFNYSAAFVILSGGIMLLSWIVFYRPREQRKPLLRNAFFIALGGYISFDIIWKFSLRGQDFPGVPGWPGMPEALLPKIEYWFRGWYDIIKSVTMFLPWNHRADMTAILFTVLFIVGIAIPLFKNVDMPAKKFYLMFASLVVLWICLMLFKRFTMAPTRHTYIFQFPILMLIGYALTQIKLNPKIYYTSSAFCFLVFALNFSTLLATVENKINPQYLLQLADENPDAILMGTYRGLTWDPRLLTVQRPDLKNRLLVAETYWYDILKNPKIDHLILISHRQGLTDENYDDLKKYGYSKFVDLKIIPPVGSIALSGNENGGNGFYVYDVRR